MKKVIAALVTLCLVTVVVPPVLNGNNDNGSDANQGISTHEYSCQGDVN